MSPDDRAHIIWTAVTGEGGKFTDIDLIGTPGFEIGDVGEPFELGRHLGQTIILARRQRPADSRRGVPNLNDILFHGRSPPPSSASFYPDNVFIGIGN